ncbi:hypothetical protein LTR08_002533 [Meristemomyces frigidus]|nr:hypothetical protein LTR08_002533 [Meristemomyces frigidus]
MVAGKSNAQSLARAAGAPKLPPLPKLRIRKPDRADANPCIGVMSSVLGCWASQGYTAQGCAVLEQSLRACMDARVRVRLYPLSLFLSLSLFLFHPPPLHTIPPADSSPRELSPKPTEAKKSNINYHLSRFYPQIIGPHKRQ